MAEGLGVGFRVVGGEIVVLSMVLRSRIEDTAVELTMCDYEERRTVKIVSTTSH